LILLSAAKYFGCIDIVRLLRRAGAVQAKDIVSDPGIYHEYGPRERDATMVEYSNGEFVRGFTEVQPFWKNHWDILYELLHD
jgi:hypothetical protein